MWTTVFVMAAGISLACAVILPGRLPFRSEHGPTDDDHHASDSVTRRRLVVGMIGDILLVVVLAIVCCAAFSTLSFA